MKVPALFFAALVTAPALLSGPARAGPVSLVGLVRTSTTVKTSTETARFNESGFDAELERRFEDAFGDDIGEDFSLERQPTVIEAIEIVGNDKTTRAAILRRLLLEVGDLVDDDQIDASRLRLLATGYFSAVEFRLRRGSRRGFVVLVLEVEERNTITIDGLYLGFSTATPFYGGLGVLESNFLGRGVSLGGGFVAGEDRRAFDARVFVPDLSDTLLQLSASGIFAQGREVLDEAAPEGPELNYSRVGGTIGIGLGVGAFQRVSLDYRLESIEVDRLPNLDPAVLRRAPSVQFDESILSTLALTYELDTRDDAFVPSSGLRVALAVETGTSLIGSSYEFTKYTADFQKAFTLFGDHALSLRLFGGMVQGRTPFFNQFFFSDFTNFAFGRDSLPRALQLNFSESNDYDDLVVNAAIDYSLLLQEGDGFLYRTYLYGRVDFVATASLDELQEDVMGRGPGELFPVSFDVGIRLDTLIGNFTVSTSYIVDLVF